MEGYVFFNGTIVLEDKLLKNCYVAVSGGLIEEIHSLPIPERYADHIHIDLKGDYLSPGFIDAHCHGGGDFDFMDGTPDSIISAARAHIKHGTTSIAPTSVTSPDDDLFTFFDCYEQALSEKESMPNLIGIHIEGQVIAESEAGAQSPDFIKQPSTGYAKEVLLHAHGNILRWSMAPEIPGALEMADYLNDHGVFLSIAHTAAMYPQILEATRHGFHHMTHFYSSMTMLRRINAYRVLGAVEAGFLLDDMHIELIADGHHLPIELLKLILKCKDHDHISLITDSMRGATMPDGQPSWLGGRKNGIEVILEDGVAKLKDRSAFAGSIATTDRLVRTMVKGCGLSIVEAVRLLTLNPAKLYGFSEQLGKIKEGFQADLIVFDENIEVSQVYVHGKRVK